MSPNVQQNLPAVNIKKAEPEGNRAKDESKQDFTPSHILRTYASFILASCELWQMFLWESECQ